MSKQDQKSCFTFLNITKNTVMSEYTHVHHDFWGGGLLLNFKTLKVVCVEQALGKRQVFVWFSRIRSSVTFAEHAKHLECQSNKQKIQKCELHTQTSPLKQRNHHQLHCTYVRNSTSVRSDHSGRQSMLCRTSTRFTPCLLCSRM